MNNSTTLKRCPKCGELKPATTEYFNRDKKRKDGLYPCCKKCKYRRENERHEQYRLEQDLNPISQKTCCRCGKIKPVAEFHHNANVKDGYHSACKQCLSSAYGIAYIRPDRNGKRFCMHCKRWHPATTEYFYWRKDQGTLTRICKVCHRKKTREKYIPTKKETAEDRFWKYVHKDTETDCWLWQGPTRGHEHYGVVNSRRLKQDQMAAHRFSWELHHGPIPEGMLVCHHCDVPSCVNPNHLFLGTTQANSDDKVHKNRQARGEANGTSILTEEQVRKIRQQYRNGKSLAKLVNEYPVAKSTLWSIVHRKTWKHIS